MGRSAKRIASGSFLRVEKEVSSAVLRQVEATRGRFLQECYREKGVRKSRERVLSAAVLSSV